MDNKRTFFQVNALCGSGKTYQAIRWAIQQAHYEDQKTVIVFKTKDLMRETYADAVGFRDSCNFVVPIKNLNRDTLSAKGETKSVRMILQQHLEEAKPNSGEVLFISEATFLAITYWPKRHWWHCVLDEIPATAPAHEFRVPDHHRMLTQHLQLEPGTATHSLVTVKPEGRAPLQRIADNAGQDQVSELFSAWARQLLSPNYRMYTSTQGFHRVATDDSQGGYFTLQMFALLQPTVFGAGTIREFADITGNPRTVKDEFASVTIMGAAFTDSLLNFIWQHEKRNNRCIRKMISDLMSGLAIDETRYAEMLASCRSDNKDLVQLKHLKEANITCTSTDGYQLNVPLFRSIHESTPAAESPFDIRDYEEFIRQLKRASRVALASKKANLLMCTTEFAADLSTDTNRGIANITRIWGIWLDIDGGEMPRHHVPSLFPDLRMAVFNSWTPRNYRIFIPTQRITSVGEHAKLMRLILREIESSALDSEITDAHMQRRAPRFLVSHKKAKLQISMGREPNSVHGIDPSKFTANSLFYMPAQSSEGSAGSFFDDHKGGKRLPLNVDLWLQRAVADGDELPEEVGVIQMEPIKEMTKLRHALSQSGSSANNGTQHDQVEIDAAMKWYKEIPDGAGRHTGFFNAVLRIHLRGNVPLADLRPYMVLCDYDGHQKSQYESILKSLRSTKFASKRTPNLAA